ncbi:hypothetical protein FRC17_006135 [Serendipita sp. 399]|nr:hypothetical protein FRC17_006135 [Serendipita sp. 399]
MSSSSFVSIFVPLIVISLGTIILTCFCVPDNWIGSRWEQIEDVAARIRREERQQERQQQQQLPTNDEHLSKKQPILYHCFIAPGSPGSSSVPQLKQPRLDGSDRQWRRAMPLTAREFGDAKVDERLALGFLIQMPTQNRNHISSLIVETSLELATIDCAKEFTVARPRISLKRG